MADKASRQIAAMRQDAQRRRRTGAAVSKEDMADARKRRRTGAAVKGKASTNDAQRRRRTGAAVKKGE